MRVVNKHNEVNPEVKLQLLSVEILCLHLCGQEHLPSFEELGFVSIIKRYGELFQQ
jgi:hypothetical protein